MKTLKSIIVEDSQQAMQALEKSLEIYCEGVEIIGKASNLDQAEELMLNTSPDIVFLDIEMHDSRTIFEVLEKLMVDKLINFEIIFVTGHEDSLYTIKAIDMMALAYILKPINGHLLNKAVEKARQRRFSHQQQKQIELMLSMIRSQSHSKSISIQLLRGDIRMTLLDDIKYIKGDGSMTEFYLSNDTLKSVKGLGHYGNILDGHPDFHRFSKSLIVNLNKMDRYRHNGCEVYMRDGAILAASRRGGKAFRDRV